MLEYWPVLLMLGFIVALFQAICQDNTMPPPTPEDDEYYGYNEDDK